MATEKTDNAATATAKVSKAFVVYIKENGETSNFPTPDTLTVKTVFANGVERELKIADTSNDIQACARAQGFAIRTQRSYQALKDIDAVIEAYDETVADLVAGIWIESKAGEAKVTMLAQAIVMTLEANGQTVDDTRKRDIIEKLKTDSYREKANANEHVTANLAQLKAEAAIARSKEAKAVAKKATVDLSDL